MGELFIQVPLMHLSFLDRIFVSYIHILLCNRTNLGIFPIHNQLSIRQITADTKRKGPADEKRMRV